MAINIKNREAEQLLAELARRRGMGKSQVVLELLRREVARTDRLSNIEARAQRIREISARASRRMAKDAPSHEEIIGYDDQGLPR